MNILIKVLNQLEIIKHRSVKLMMKLYKTAKKMRIKLNNKIETGLNTHNFLGVTVSHNIILSVNDKPKLDYIFLLFTDKIL